MSLCRIDLAGRSFPSCNKPLLQNEAKYKAIDMAMIFCSRENQTLFHKKGLAISLVLKVIVFAQAYHPNCSRHRDVPCGMRFHTFTVFHNVFSRLDSDWENAS